MLLDKTSIMISNFDMYIIEKGKYKKYYFECIFCKQFYFVSTLLAEK
jgi:hypothetical protein